MTYMPLTYNLSFAMLIIETPVLPGLLNLCWTMKNTGNFKGVYVWHRKRGISFGEAVGSEKSDGPTGNGENGAACVSSTIG